MANPCKDIFTELISLLQSNNNINLTDNKNNTVLHTITRKIYQDPSLGTALMEILPKIISSNVNSQDENGVTPSTWILKGKKDYYHDSSVKDIFCKIEELFQKKSADLNIAEAGLEYTKRYDYLYIVTF